MWRQVPNLLGLLRILTTPVLVWLILLRTPAGYLGAALLLVLMAVSDFYDGWLARRWKVVSPLGVFLDTISDKIFVAGALVPMAEVGLLSTWVVLVIIIREFIISGLRSYAGASGVVISAGPWGKQKLAITVVALVWALLAAYGAVGGSMAALPLGPITLQTIFNLWPIPMALAVFWTIASAVDYLWKSWSLLRNGWSPEAAAEATSTRPVSRKS